MIVRFGDFVVSGERLMGESLEKGRIREIEMLIVFITLSQPQKRVSF